MISRFAALTTLVLLGGAAAFGTESGEAAKKWIAGYERYAAQKEIELEYPGTRRRGDEKRLFFSDLLRTLPDPGQWPQYRRVLADTAARTPAAETLRKQRLQAGNWLLAYLAGDRDAISAELTALLAATDKNTPAGYSLRELREGLRDEAEPPAAEQLRLFEEQLTAHEPVSEDEVRAVVGGAENLARLNRVIEVSRQMQEDFQKIYAEYEKTKDEASARAKSEALQKQYQEKIGADEQALLPYVRNPLIARYATNRASTGEGSSAAVSSVDVPDLVRLAGRERAEVLLRRTLRLPAKLSVAKGDETRRLARELALAGIDTLQAPQWSLVSDENSVGLFEALQKRYPKVAADDYDYKPACGCYLVGLILAGRASDAASFAAGIEPGKLADLPGELMDKLEKAGRQQELWSFLRAWLAKNPAADEWDRFNRLSVELERQAELSTLIATMAADGSFRGLDRMRVQRMQAAAELATDRLAAGVERLRGLLVSPAASADELRAQLEVAERLLTLADLQGDSALYAATLAQSESFLEVRWKNKPADYLGNVATLVSLLNGMERYTDSLRLSRTATARIPKLEEMAKTETKDENARVQISSYETQRLLIEQLCAEVELSHWKEARALLEKNPGWGARDVAGLLSLSTSAGRRPAGYYAARVARAQGDKALARRLLEAQLVATPGVDAAYQLYLEVAGKDARPLLEKLYATDRYEERPLIWQSELQARVRDWDGAIVTLQRAIETDPSDGEQGRGDRMRVYAFMGKAMAAKGDQAKAKFFEGVVKTIRLSETADRWFEAGAYERAIALYRQALEYFQDAYCVQSRLAIRLANEGKMAEALEHYRRAYELMPGSFGRVESHCFGCERVFKGEKAQGMAEEVFERLLKEQPGKPQVHYLLGYLRQEQDRPQEAAGFFREAVKLDPLYLNAWDKLADLSEKLEMTAAERDDLRFKLVELDPAGRHVSPNLNRVADIPRLWTALHAARRLLDGLPASESVWPLKASAARVAADPENFSMVEFQLERRDPAMVLLDHRFLRALQSYLGSLNEPREAEGEEPAPGAKGS